MHSPLGSLDKNPELFIVSVCVEIPMTATLTQRIGFHPFKLLTAFICYDVILGFSHLKGLV